MLWGLIIGFLLGVGVSIWQSHRLKAELAKILTFSPDIRDLVPSLSVLSLVHREFLYFQKLRQKQEEALKVWQNLLNQAPIGFLWIDAENQLLWCNQAAKTLLQIYRWQPTQVRLLLELVRSYELDQLIEVTRSRQQSQVREWIYYPSAYPLEERNQGNLANIQGAMAVKASAYPLSQGEIAVFIENQQPLRELSQSRDRTVSDLTHELRTPLTSILLLAETLEKRLNPPESRWSAQICLEVNRLITLIEEWLDLSQLQENSGQGLRVEQVRVEEVVREAWRSLEPLAQQKSLTLVYQDPEQISLNGDRHRLLQVMLNLLDNSIKHSPDQGQIWVIVAYLEENVEIEVIDQGSGFLMADLPYIFDRLYRGERSRTRPKNVNEQSSREGNGLGLAIVQQIIQAHHGSIIAQNHPDTQGAWLQILLPR